MFINTKYYVDKAELDILNNGLKKEHENSNLQHFFKCNCYLTLLGTKDIQIL